MENYYKHLSRVQNHDIISYIIDIMTITGMMNWEQKIQHLLRYAEETKDVRAIDFCNDNKER